MLYEHSTSVKCSVKPDFLSCLSIHWCNAEAGHRTGQFQS